MPNSQDRDEIGNNHQRGKMGGKEVKMKCKKHNIEMNYNPFDNSEICLKCAIQRVKTPFGMIEILKTED